MPAQSLSNPDLAPTTPEQRTWTAWHVAALWIGMAVCIPTYMLAAGMIQQGMSWWQAVLTVLLGNLIVLVPMILNGHPGTKYGVPFPVLVRASFGTRGAHVPSIARALVACGWFGIQTWIGGAAIYQILSIMGWINATADAVNTIPAIGITPWQLACFLAFWGIHVGIVLKGIRSIKWLEVLSAPFLLACGIALLLWAVLKVERPGDLFQSSHFPEGRSFWHVFFPQLTAMVGFWATLSLNIPDFTRYCRSQRDQAVGQLVGLPPTMTLFCFIGIIVTAATVALYGEAIWDPVALVGRMGSSAMVVAFALLALTVATLSTNLAANVVSPANGFSNLWPSRISFRAGAIITCVIGVLIQPWYLLSNLGAYIFTWLIGYSALLGPIAGIMLCDYFLLRRTRMSIEDLYREDGRYRGVNWRAMVVLVLAVLPNLPGFINAATNTAGTDRAPFGPFWDTLYGYAWFVGLPLAAVLYAAAMWRHPSVLQDRSGPAPA